MIGIYKITSPSGKIYIGQSWNLQRRKTEYSSSHGIKFQVALYNSIKKYTWSNHVFSIIHELPKDITQEVIDRYEVLYWEQYKSLGIKMLNIKEPGSGGKHSEETKKKMRDKRKLQIFSNQSKEKMSISASKLDHTIKIQRLEKFRQPGEANPRATLTEQQVKNIKTDAIKGIKRKDIVRKYSTTKSIVDNILVGKSWKHIQ